MPRSCKHRHCRELGGLRIFKPTGTPLRSLPVYRIGIDEFEAMRLCDREGASQIEAAASMAVSRGTVQRLLERGRRTVIAAFLDNAALQLLDRPVREEERRLALSSVEPLEPPFAPR